MFGTEVVAIRYRHTLMQGTQTLIECSIVL